MDDFDFIYGIGGANKCNMKEQFTAVLGEFGAGMNEPLALDDKDDTVTFSVDDEFLIHLKYLNQSDAIVAFSPVGAFGGTRSRDSGEKALALLRYCELGGLSEGFTLALDEEADLIVAMDKRTALEISSVDALSAWVDALTRVVNAVRVDFSEQFPAMEE